MKTRTFMASDLLLPTNCELNRWAVIASDQYISQEDYWQNLEEFVGRAPSALRMTLPESCLDGPDMETDIMSVNSVMSEYLRGNRFQSYENAMIYLERTLDNGQIRQGILGMIDLEEFDYTLQSQSKIRPSEATSLLRLPPRVAARKNAPLETSHVILLVDDDRNLIFDGISKENPLYDVDLMMNGGRVQGWLLNEADQNRVLELTENLGADSHFQKKYEGETIQFAVGDGHHTLASAKESYERQKKIVHPEDWQTLPSRFAMVELVNLHQEAVELNSFHRVIHGVNPQEFLRDFRVFVEEFPENDLESLDFNFYFAGTHAPMSVKNPISTMEIYTLDSFLQNKYPKAHVEYFLDQTQAKNQGEKANTICIILPDLNKELFYKTLSTDGILPEKTFSLGQASHKRFYLEARKIR